jgi:hypothetical protein
MSELEMPVKNSPMKRLLTCLIGFFALAVSGHTVSFLVKLRQHAAITLLSKEMMYQSVACPQNQKAKAKGLQVLSTHQWSQGVVVLYSAVCPGKTHQEPMQRVIGHKVVKRNGMHWQLSGSDSYGIQTNAPVSERLVEYSISKSSESGRDRYAILYGQVLKAKVTAVEATFDNGQVVRGRGDEGVFALLSPGATAICELRVIGNDNQILKQEDLAHFPHFKCHTQIFNAKSLDRQRIRDFSSNELFTPY